MKYLIFDIECANCFDSKYKICEFGYVVTDENFNVLYKEVLPMSPGNKYNRSDRFDTSIYKRDPKFQWAYDFDYYYSCDKFTHFYEKIKKLLEDKETRVFAFSADNDIRYLESESERYILDRINFDVIDIQTIYSYYKKYKTNISNTRAYKEICGNIEIAKLNPHLSRDDAYISMRILEKICKDYSKTLDEIIEEVPNAFYNSNCCYLNYRQGEINKKERRSIKIKAKSHCQVVWGAFYREYIDLINDEKSIGRRVTVSAKIKEKEEDLLSVIEAIKRNNFIASDRISTSDIIVVLDDKDKERMSSSLQYPYDGKYYTLEEFIGL